MFSCPKRQSLHTLPYVASRMLAIQLIVCRTHLVTLFALLSAPMTFPPRSYRRSKKPFFALQNTHSAVGHLPRTSVACLTLSSHYRLFARLFTPSRRTHPQETHRLSQLCQVKQPHRAHKCLGSLQSLGIQILLRVRQVCCLRDTHSLTGRKDDRGRSLHHPVHDAYDGPQGHRRVSDTRKCPPDVDRQRDQRRRNLAPRPHAADPPEPPACMRHTHTC